MGIAKGALSLLFELKTTETLQGTVCQLGRQGCFVTEAQVGDIAKRFGFRPPSSGFTQSKKSDKGMVDDEYLFRSLGFDYVESIDANNFERATHILDFNKDIPDEFCGRYDVVFDGGTLEHIFNLPQCLKNIYKMLKPGGIIIHGSPSNNHVDHGFYQFSPTLFYDYYSMNNWTILRSNIFEYTPDHASKPWLIYDYKPGSIDHMSFGGWGKKMLGIWFVAKKNSESRGDLIPMQGAYVKAWAVKPGNENMSAIQRKGFLAQLKQIVKSNKYSYWIALRLYIPYQRVFSKPKVIAKY